MNVVKVCGRRGGDITKDLIAFAWVLSMPEKTPCYERSEISVKYKRLAYSLDKMRFPQPHHPLLSPQTCILKSNFGGVSYNPAAVYMVCARERDLFSGAS